MFYEKNKKGKTFRDVRSLIAQHGDIIPKIREELSSGSSSPIDLIDCKHSPLDNFRYNIVANSTNIYDNYPLYTYYSYDANDNFMKWCVDNAYNDIIPHYSHLQALLSLAYKIDCREIGWEIKKSKMVNGDKTISHFYIKLDDEIFDPYLEYTDYYKNFTDESDVGVEQYFSLTSIPIKIYAAMGWSRPNRSHSVGFIKRDDKLINLTDVVENEKNLIKHLFKRRLSDRALLRFLPTSCSSDSL